MWSVGKERKGEEIGTYTEIVKIKGNLKGSIETF